MNNKVKVISMILAVIMIVSVVPLGVFAAGETNGITVTVGAVQGDKVKVADPTTKERYTYELDEDGVDSGSYYLIVAPSNPVAMDANDGSLLTKNVTISNNTKITLDEDEDCGWVITASGSSYTIVLPPRATLTHDNNVKTWSVTNRGSGAYRITYSTTSWRGTTTHYLRYYNGSFATNTSTTGANLRLFKRTSTTTVPDAPEQYASATVTSKTISAAGMTQAEILQAVKDTATVYIYSGDSTTGVETDDFTVEGAVNPAVAGVYDVNIKVNNITVATTTVTVSSKEIDHIAVADPIGAISKGAISSADVGAMIEVTYTDGTSIYIPVTLGMVSGELDRNAPGRYENLTINYEGFTAHDFIIDVVGDLGEGDYPEYPHDCSVKVDKKGEGIDFLSTGVAKIELSAAALVQNRPIDVVVMVDTSSSMTYGDSSSQSAAPAGQQRIDMLHNSLKEMIEKFNTPDSHGVTPDVKVAIADFNGYKSIDSSHDVIQGPNYGGTPKIEVEVYTAADGETMNASAFKQSTEITESLINSITPPTSVGTNYDYAFDTIYRLASSIKDYNETNGLDRDLYVIFMSDGCPFQFNYFESSYDYTIWNKWLLGTWTNDDWSNVGNYSPAHKYFYNSTPNEYGELNSHRMAEAIKGDPNDTFTVISPNNTLPHSTKLTGTNSDYMYTVPGLGATMYSIGFCINDTTNIKKESALHVLETIASENENGKRLFFNASNQAELTRAFTQITPTYNYAARDSRFIDTLGAQYDIQLANFDDQGVTKFPVMEVKEYTIYKQNDVGKTIGTHLVTAEDVGKRYGTGNTLETVTFSADGTQAYSNLIGSGRTNILENGVIKAKNFFYNTTSSAVNVSTEFDDIYSLAPETFYWSIGSLDNREVALSYYVYLTDSMAKDGKEGSCPAGSYPTNESAVLHYTNWLDHETHKDTISPIFPWKAAQVNYAYYLVDENGNPVVNKETGATGSFANRVVLTNPTLYQEIMLNSSSDIPSLTLSAEDLFHEGYELYSPEASYKVGVSSDGRNSYWTISDSTNTTYVTNYHGNDATRSNANSKDNPSYEYTNTVVWFAVKFSLKAVPDIVVIDYGVSVDINVIDNDMLGGYGRLDLIGNGSQSTQPKDRTEPTGFVKTITTTHGTATVKDDNTVRYTPTSMTMNSIDTFLYAAKYESTAASNNGYYYSYVKVVPATSIYYEDTNEKAEFVKFTGNWSEAGSGDFAVQAEDRPGMYSLVHDANNNYGFDSAYSNSKTYSLGNAKKTTVKALTKGDAWPTAEFTFTGTGFEIISVTDSTTGFIKVDVYDAESGAKLKSWAVDTYYGYSSVERIERYVKCDWLYNNGAWHVTREEVDKSEAEENLDIALPTSPTEGTTCTTYELDQYEWTTGDMGTLYQIPVIKSYDTLKYGKYRVVVTPMYSKLFDHPENGSYDFYFDSVKIFDPADSSEKTDDEILEFYKQDNEAYPQYIEMRQQLINAKSFDSGEVETSGAVFIDAFGKEGDISEYTSFGPNNEIYLKPGQSVAFTITGNGSDVASNVASVQIGAKCVNGDTSFTVNGKEISVATSTDMYYNITGVIKWNSNSSSDTIVITNTNENSIVSLTTMKITYKENPKAMAKMFVSRSMAAAAVQTVYENYIASITEPVKPIESKDSGEEFKPYIVVDDAEDAPAAFIPYIRRDTDSTEKAPVSDREGTFVPNKFDVTLAKNKATAGQTVRMTIVTSAEVAAVWVNGEKATLYSTDSSTGEKTFRYVVTCTSMGEKTVAAVAYNADGVSSRSVDSMIKVTANKK